MLDGIGNQVSQSRQQAAVQNQPNLDRSGGDAAAGWAVAASSAQAPRAAGPSALQALQGTFAARGIDPGNFPRNLSSIAQAASTITAYGDAAPRNLAGAMLGAASAATGRPVIAVDNLRADDGTKLDGVRLANGQIQVDSALTGAALASVLVEELGEYAYAQLGRGASPGDFGAEFAARLAGESDPKLLQALQNGRQDDRVMVGGVGGEARSVPNGGIAPYLLPPSAASIPIDEFAFAAVTYTNFTVAKKHPRDGHTANVFILAEGFAPQTIRHLNTNGLPKNSAVVVDGQTRGDNGLYVYQGTDDFGRGDVTVQLFGAPSEWKIDKVIVTPSAGVSYEYTAYIRRDNPNHRVIMIDIERVTFNNNNWSQ